MSITVLLAKAIGAVLAFIGLYLVIQHLGFNLDLLVGLVLIIIGVWLLLGKSVSI